MRRPSNLVKTLAPPEPTRAAAEPQPASPANYLDLYGLAKPPFGTAGYILFGSHRRGYEALLEHAVNGGGVVLLLGEEGSGKTETLRSIAALARESGAKVALITRPPDGRLSKQQLVDTLGAVTNDPAKFPYRAVLIDDVDLMPTECIDPLAILLQAKPDNLSFILSTSAVLTGEGGRPELAPLVSALRDTIRLPRLGPGEIRQYIERSLWISGGTTRRLIAPEAMKVIITRSGGIPAMVNRLMEATFTAGFARGDPIITARTVNAAIGPMAIRTPPPPKAISEPDRSSGAFELALQIVAIGLLIAGLAVFLYRGLQGPAKTPPAAPPVPAQSATLAPPSRSAPTAPAQPQLSLPPALMAALMKRGSESLELGDTAAARLLFLRAADAGNAEAATALGKTYDPNFTSVPSARNPIRAKEWYQKAITLGDPKARDLLKRLSGP